MAAYNILFTEEQQSATVIVGPMWYIGPDRFEECAILGKQALDLEELVWVDHGKGVGRRHPGNHGGRHGRPPRPGLATACAPGQCPAEDVNDRPACGAHSAGKNGSEGRKDKIVGGNSDDAQPAKSIGHRQRQQPLGATSRPARVWVARVAGGDDAW